MEIEVKTCPNLNQRKLYSHNKSVSISSSLYWPQQKTVLSDTTIYLSSCMYLHTEPHRFYLFVSPQWNTEMHLGLYYGEVSYFTESKVI